MRRVTCFCTKIKTVEWVPTPKLRKPLCERRRLATSCHVEEFFFVDTILELLAPKLSWFHRWASPWSSVTLLHPQRNSEKSMASTPIQILGFHVRPKILDIHRYSHFISILGQQKLPVSFRLGLSSCRRPMTQEILRVRALEFSGEIGIVAGKGVSTYINQFLPLIVGFSCNMLLQFWEIAATYFVLYPPNWRLKNWHMFRVASPHIVEHGVKMENLYNDMCFWQHNFWPCKIIAGLWICSHWMDDSMLIVSLSCDIKTVWWLSQRNGDFTYRQQAHDGNQNVSGLFWNHGTVSRIRQS